MNLADAIRKAAVDVNGSAPFGPRPMPQPGLQPAEEPVAPVVQTVAEEIPIPEVQKVAEPVAAKPKPEPKLKPEIKTGGPANPDAPQVDGTEGREAMTTVNGNVVRLEIFMTPEQMTGMLKALMAGQHSVMTVREAAAYLRVKQTTLEKLADEGEIPAVEIDGKWRFPKIHLDEWLAHHSSINEEIEDVA